MWRGPRHLHQRFTIICKRALKSLSSRLLRRHNVAAMRVQVGSGVQICCAALVTLLLAAAGVISSASSGALLTSALALCLLCASSAGYAAVMIWANTTRSSKGWLGICLCTSCYVPGARRCRTTHTARLLADAPGL